MHLVKLVTESEKMLHLGLPSFVLGVIIAWSAKTHYAPSFFLFTPAKGKIISRLTPTPCKLSRFWIFFFFFTLLFGTTIELFQDGLIAICVKRPRRSYHLYIPPAPAPVFQTFFYALANSIPIMQLYILLRTYTQWRH